MKTFRITAVLTVILMVLTVAAIADEVKQCPCQPVAVEFGNFFSTDGAYKAWDVTVSQKGVHNNAPSNIGSWSGYYEDDTKSPYWLLIGTYGFDERGDKAVLRIDQGKVRAGIAGPIAAGFSGRVLVGNDKNRLDIWTPCVPLAKLGDHANIGVYGWFMPQEGSQPNTWIVPTMSIGKLTVEYEYNLNRSGGDFWDATYGVAF